MREAYLDMEETFANETYEKEFVVTKRIFQQVKNDLVCKLEKLILYIFYQIKLCFYIISDIELKIDISFSKLFLQYTVVDTIFSDNDGFKELLAVSNIIFIKCNLYFL